MENKKIVFQKTFSGTPAYVDEASNDFRSKTEIRPLATHTGMSGGKSDPIFFTTIFYTLINA